MKSITLSFAVGAIAVAAFAQTPTLTRALPGANNAVQPKKLSKAEASEAIKRYTGGRLKQPNYNKGSLVIVNAQKTAPKKWLDEVARAFIAQDFFDVFVRDGEFSFPNPKIEGSVSLYVVDDDKLPSVLHAPDSRWTMVNLAQLKSGEGAKPSFFEARTKKQLARGFSMAAGAQKSSYAQSLLLPMTSPEKFDSHLDWRIPVDVHARFKEYLSELGVTPYRIVSYRKACEEGWAPQPTNDYQKAIWEKSHQLPTKPLTIEK